MEESVGSNTAVFGVGLLIKIKVWAGLVMTLFFSQKDLHKPLVSSVRKQKEGLAIEPKPQGECWNYLAVIKAIQEQIIIFDTIFIVRLMLS